MTTFHRPSAATAPVGDSSFAEKLGNTPLVRLKHVTKGFVPVFAKAEWLNPSGSVKDRAAFRMILEGERSGRLSVERTIVDATSGNTGIALAMFGVARGYHVHVFLPSNASPERKKRILGAGAELTLTDPLEGTDGAQRRVKELVRKYPDRYYYPDQYNNPVNWQAHYFGTGEEILRDTHPKVTHFVVGLGTSGTFVGTSRRLKEFDKAIVCISMQPDSPLHGIEGLKHMATAIVPGIYDPSLADASMSISTEEALAMTRRLALEEQLVVGVSSGANVAAAVKVASSLSQGVVVTILCDDGRAESRA